MPSGTRENLARSTRRMEAPAERAWLVVNQRVLAERNQAVMPVGAWVESARERWKEEGQSRALVSAFHVEEELKKQQQEKQEHLRRFQGEVKHRVNQHARMRKKQQLMKSYDAAEKDGIVVRQCSNAAGHLTPKRNTCVYRKNTELAICSPGSRWVSAQQLGDHIEEATEEDTVEERSELFQQQAKTLSKTMKQVRSRLASCKTVPEGDFLSELPGGIWKVSPTRDNPVSRRSSPVHMTEVHEEVDLEGHHDLPAELQGQTLVKRQAGKEDGLHCREEHGKVCDRLMKEPYPTGPAPAFSTDYRAALVLRPGVDLEENKKQRENQYLMYRRLFMDIEREQVKEMRRQKEHEKRIEKIKNEKELHRHAEEQRIHRLQEPNPEEREREMLAQLKLEEQKWKVNEEKKQKSKEHVRYIDALRAQMKEKILLNNVELPPLCCCGMDFWDSHPDTCANNCVFYRNPKAYAQALQSVISSCLISDGSATTKSSARAIASARAHSFKNS